MKISRDTLRGYILEEVLAYLIRNTGYRLLVNDSQDPQELGWRSNGLVVKGRGGVHQVDVLGELSWVPAFTYPLRLFVEAKFRKLRTGIPEVRNMVATLLDVNQNNLPQVTREAGSNPQLRPKYYYAGAIFSAAGFSVPAMDMALAHNVSLIDLNTSEFKPLLDAVTGAAQALLRQFATAEDDVDDETEDNEEAEPPRGQGPFRRHRSRSVFIFALRTALRRQLGTLTEEAKIQLGGLEEDLLPALQDSVDAAVAFKELFVGMGRGPYMLVLKADDPAAFLAYSRANPTHDVTITWSEDYDDGGTWQISPVVPAARTPYRLTFRVPEAIRDWIFSSENVRRAALDAKKLYFSSICIFYNREERDLLIRLRFKPEEVRRRNKP